METDTAAIDSGCNRLGTAKIIHEGHIGRNHRGGKHHCHSRWASMEPFGWVCRLKSNYGIDMRDQGTPAQ
jgi:hypothetical protein